MAPLPQFQAGIFEQKLQGRRVIGMKLEWPHVARDWTSRVYNWFTTSMWICHILIMRGGDEAKDVRKKEVSGCRLVCEKYECVFVTLTVWHFLNKLHKLYFLATEWNKIATTDWWKMEIKQYKFNFKFNFKLQQKVFF